MDKSPKNILIVTGIFPPDIGGSAFYAKTLSEEFRSLGNRVDVATFGSLRKFPSGLRHLIFAIKIIPLVLKADFVIALDTFSVAVPTVFISRLLGKKVAVRSGGDFLWEEYVERKKKNILLSEFYENNRDFSVKEKIIFKLTGLALRTASSPL